MRILILFTQAWACLWPNFAAADVWDSVIPTTSASTERPAPAPARAIAYLVHGVATSLGVPTTDSADEMLADVVANLGPTARPADYAAALRLALRRQLPHNPVRVRASAVTMINASKARFGVSEVKAIEYRDLLPQPRRLVFFWSVLLDENWQQIPQTAVQIVRSAQNECLHLLDPSVPEADVRLEFFDETTMNEARVPTFEYVGHARPRAGRINVPAGYVWIEF